MELFWFLLGTVTGWAIEWVIDARYWRGLGTRPPANNAFKADLAALRTRFDDAQDKIVRYEVEVADLRAQLEEGVTTDVAELHERLRLANAEIAALKTTIPETPTDNSLAAELAEAKAMIDRLQSENNTSPLIALNELQAKLDEAETELAGYRSVEEISRIELQELRQKLADAESKGSSPKNRSAANEEIAQLKQQLAAKEEELMALRSAPSVSTSESSAEVEALKTKASQADYFSKQLDNARATIAMLEQEMLRPQAPPPAALDDESKRKLMEMETEMLRLRSGFESKNEEIDSLRNQLQQREQTIQTMVSIDELAEARARADAAEERVTMLMSDRQHGIEELDTLRKQAEAGRGQMDLISSLRQEIEDLSVKLAHRDQSASETRSEFNSLSAKLHATQTELEDLRTSRSARDAEVTALRDELSNLKAEMADMATLQARVNAAEIELEAYNDLKAAKEQLQDRVGLLEGELAEAKAQAKEAELEAKTREAEKAAAEVAQLRAHLDHHRRALANALSQLDNFEAPAAAPPAVDAPSNPEVENRDPLEKIQGIGFVYERKLWDAGILTFEDLANSTPEEVTAAISPEEWQEIEPKSWIAAAKKLISGG